MIFLYFYPNENSVGIYQVTGEFHFTIKMVSKCVAGICIDIQHTRRNNK
jgi:hypothetical protein